MILLAFIIAFVIIIFLLGYFIPTFIAILRKKKNTLAIFLVNLFFGMTFVGWIGALIWSIIYEDKDFT